MIEQRVAIHEYARQIVTRGWIQPSFPESVLLHDFQNVCESDHRLCLKNSIFSFPRRGKQSVLAGRKLMMHYFDFSSEFWPILKRPILTIKLLNSLFKQPKKFNFTNLLMNVTMNYGNAIKHAPTPQIQNPLIYTTIFKQLKLEGALLDINVGLGARAIAAAAAGLEYTTNDPEFNYALDRGFVGLTGMKYNEYTSQKVDVAIYDNAFNVPDMATILPYLNKAKKLLVFCPHIHAQHVLKFKPQTSLRVKVRRFSKIPEYIFVW